MKTNRQRITVRQRDMADCGPACISSVMAYHGIRVPVARIRQLAGTDRKGTSMWGMVTALQKLGFEARGMRGTAEHLDRLPLPFIAHLENGDGFQHYVCVYRVKKDRIRVMDPGSGTLSRCERKDFREKWSGAVIVMVRRAGKIEPGRAQSTFSRLYALIRPVSRTLLQALLAAAIYIILGLSTSIYLGKLTDQVFVTRNSGLLNLMSIVMVAITVLMTYLQVIRQLIVLRTGQVIDNQLITSYYRHLLRLPQRFFDSMRTGEILSRINDAIKIRGFINDAVISILVNFMIVLFSFLPMFMIDRQLGLLMLGIIPLYLVIYTIYNHRNRFVERCVMERAASLESQLVDSLQGATHMRQHNLSRLTRERTENRLNSFLDMVYRSGINSIRAAGGMEFINRIFTVILLWVGSGLVIRQQVTPGGLLSFYALIGYFTGPVSALVGANRTYQNCMIAADRLFEIFDLEQEKDHDKRTFRREDFGDIVFHRVCFSYGTRGDLFRELDLVIPSGRVTAIRGPSGSGKSTVASLVQHLYPVDRGRITINGCDTRYYSGESIRRLIGVVPQEIRFTPGQILENIAPGESSPDMMKISRLLESVGLRGPVESLPAGLESPLGDNGVNLSGGERQRLALVRALYRDPALLILDEATSALDPDSEFHVNRLLLGLKERSLTILLISHSSRITSLADHLLVMECGQIREICQ